MSSTLGQLSEFRPGHDRLSVYLERFEMYVAANGVPNDKKAPLFLTVVGSTVFSLLHDLFQPEKLAGKTYKELTDKLTAHFNPKPVNVLAHRHTFHRRSQGATESIADYMAELRRLASFCEFDAFLDQALRDRLVFRVKSEAMQRRLLTEKDPKLVGILELALSLEAAQKNAQTIQQTNPTMPVHRTEQQQQKPRMDTDQKCYRCGQEGHSPSHVGAGMPNVISVAN